MSVTVDDDRQLPEIVAALEQFAEVSVEQDMAILCAVGDNLTHRSAAGHSPALGARGRAAADGVAGRVAAERHLRAERRDVAAAMTRLHDAAFDARAAWVRAR